MHRLKNMQWPICAYGLVSDKIDVAPTSLRRLYADASGLASALIACCETVLEPAVEG